MMKITLTPNDAEKDSYQLDNVYRFAHEFYEFSGNIHIIKTDMIDTVYDTISENVIVSYQDGTQETVENYSISSIEEL